MNFAGLPTSWMSMPSERRVIFAVGETTRQIKGRIISRSPPWRIDKRRRGRFLSRDWYRRRGLYDRWRS